MDDLHTDPVQPSRRVPDATSRARFQPLASPACFCLTKPNASRWCSTTGSSSVNLFSRWKEDIPRATGVRFPGTSGPPRSPSPPHIPNASPVQIATQPSPERRPFTTSRVPVWQSRSSSQQLLPGPQLIGLVELWPCKGLEKGHGKRSGLRSGAAGMWGALHQDVSSGDGPGGRMHGPGCEIKEDNNERVPKNNRITQSRNSDGTVARMVGETPRQNGGDSQAIAQQTAQVLVLDGGLGQGRDPGLLLRGEWPMAKKDSSPNEKRGALILKEFCRRQSAGFVGNQKAVLGITEGSGRVDLDQKDEQRKAKEDRPIWSKSHMSLLRGDKMGIHFLPEMFPGRYEPERRSPRRSGPHSQHSQDSSYSSHISGINKEKEKQETNHIDKNCTTTAMRAAEGEDKKMDGKVYGLG
ncbi:hypothetical protein B0H14DRAFT_2587465 [Mycena olivaceomarginata]|nr:hypothetical protein B0H14DRAFT_2587465 [Mycena olivaceomarginata]